MTIFSVTEIGVFKRCRLLWSFSYQDKIQPISEQPYFFMGRMVHRTLAEWTDNQSLMLEEIWARALVEEVEFYKTRYKDQIGAEPSESEIDLVMEQAHKPFIMAQNYRQRWKSPLPEGYTLIQSEQTCLVDIPNTEHWECENHHVLQEYDIEWEEIDPNSLGNGVGICPICQSKVTWQCIQLEGTLDGLIFNKVMNKLFVLERKTYENRPVIKTLESNEQFVGYAWILTKLFPNYDVGGILYDGAWKREVPPRGKKFEDLFFRHLITKDDEELARWEQQLTEVALDMLGTPRIYPNRTWIGCFDDKSYEPLCTALSKGDDWEYVKETFYAVKPDKVWFSDMENDD